MLRSFSVVQIERGAGLASEQMPLRCVDGEKESRGAGVSRAAVMPFFLAMETYPRPRHRSARASELRKAAGDPPQHDHSQITLGYGSMAGVPEKLRKLLAPNRS